MTTSTPKIPNEEISDVFSNGKLRSRTITRGDMSYSMSFLPEVAAFNGNVMKKDGDSYNMIYDSMEDANDEYAQLPYPELNELRDMLAKIWAEEIRKWRQSHKAMNEFSALLDKKN